MRPWRLSVHTAARWRGRSRTGPSCRPSTSISSRTRVGSCSEAGPAAGSRPRSRRPESDEAAAKTAALAQRPCQRDRLSTG